MCSACDYCQSMTVMIQIRNVPDALHRKLKARAALAGQTLSNYLLQQVDVIAARPTMEELRDRLASRKSVEPTLDPVALIREERDRC